MDKERFEKQLAFILEVDKEKNILPTRRVPPRGTPRVPAPLPLSPFSPPAPLPLSPFSPPDRDRRGDSPAWSGRGSRPSRRTSG